MVSELRDGSRSLNHQTFTGPWAGLPVVWFGSSGVERRGWGDWGLWFPSRRSDTMKRWLTS